MNSKNSTSRSTSESSTMKGETMYSHEMKTPETYEGMALSRIVKARRLTGLSKTILKANDIDLDNMQAELFSYAFAVNLQHGYDEEISVQQVMRATADAVYNMTTDLHQLVDFDLRQWLPVAKHIVHAFVADGWIDYNEPRTYKKKDESGYATMPAFYTMTGAQRKKMIADILHDEPTIIPRYLKKGTEHYKGAMALSAKKFQINVERAAKAREMLNTGHIINKDGQWIPVDLSIAKDAAKHDQQRRQFMDAVAAYRAKPEGWHYAVKADFRGRLYYVSGMLNPQAGGVAAYILGNDNTVTYDSTASFAQFISILTGDIKLAAACNLRNYNEPVKDFYAETYAIASGNAAPAKNTVEREIAKKYLMPKAYGSGDATSEARAMDTAREQGIDESIALAIVDSLKSYTGLNTVKDAAAQAVLNAAAAGQQLSWVSPSGFKVTQNYWRTETLEWDTGEDSQEFIPTSVTFKIKTDKVAVSTKDDESNERSANVAAAANYIQSLDAAFAAMVAADWHKAGHTLVAVHDSFTFDKELAEEFKVVAWKAFCQIAFSKELADMRTIIGLPQKELFWVNPDRIPRFIDQE